MTASNSPPPSLCSQIHKYDALSHVWKDNPVLNCVRNCWVKQSTYKDSSKDVSSVFDMTDKVHNIITGTDAEGRDHLFTQNVQEDGKINTKPKQQDDKETDTSAHEKQCEQDGNECYEGSLSDDKMTITFNKDGVEKRMDLCYKLDVSTEEYGESLVFLAYQKEEGGCHYLSKETEPVSKSSEEKRASDMTEEPQHKEHIQQRESKKPEEKQMLRNERARAFAYFPKGVRACEGDTLIPSEERATREGQEERGGTYRQTFFKQRKSKSAFTNTHSSKPASLSFIAGPSKPCSSGFRLGLQASIYGEGVCACLPHNNLSGNEE